MIRAGGAFAGAFGLAVAGAAGLWSGFTYGVWEGGSPLAGLFPALAGGALLGFGLLVAGSELFRPSEIVAPPAPPQWRRVLGYLAGLLAFAFLMEPLGTVPMIVLMFLWLLAGVEKLPWRVALPVTIGAAAGVWLLFERLLQVSLPRGLLG